MTIDIIKLEEFLNSLVSDMNESLVIGYVNIKGLLCGELKEYDFCVVIGKKLDDTILDAIGSGPTPEYYALYNRINAELYQIGLGLSEYLTSRKILNHLIKTIKKVSYFFIIYFLYIYFKQEILRQIFVI